MSPKSKIIWTTTAIAAFLIVVMSGPQRNSGRTEITADGIVHGHGIAVDIADPGRLYIATHYGLLVLTEDKKLFRIGDSRDDFMGFSIDTRDPKKFYRSGHPQGGGNIGFQVSEDGGATWRTLSPGADGPVDFHAMAVSPAEPAVIYGWYKGLQRSVDGGLTWEVVNQKIVIQGLAADPRDMHVVYGASGDSLLLSKDQGATWLSVHPEVRGAFSLAIHPQDPQRMAAATRNGLTLTADGGATWTKAGNQFGGENPLYLAYDPRTPSKMYALTNKNRIYRSADDGKSWEIYF